MRLEVFELPVRLCLSGLGGGGQQLTIPKRANTLVGTRGCQTFVGACFRSNTISRTVALWKVAALRRTPPQNHRDFPHGCGLLYVRVCCGMAAKPNCLDTKEVGCCGALAQHQANRGRGR